MRRWLLVAGLLLWGCDDGGSATEPTEDADAPEAGPMDMGAGGAVGDATPPPNPDLGIPDSMPPDAAPIPDTSDVVFEPTRLVEVVVEMDPGDYDILRQQNRGGINRQGEDCLGAPFPSPYDWFHARVTVDGQTYEDVGVRKKGFFGSVSSSRPSLKIRMDKYVEGLHHESLTRITLNNNRQDPSLLRTCLAYQVFAAAGAPTPRCNFAKLTVNGEDLGIYSHVESLKKPFLRRHFEDPEGYLYEGTLSDFRPDWRGTIEQKTNESTPEFGAVDRLAEALTLPDEELIPALEQVLDLDLFLQFWAAEVITTHWDGYSGNTNNFWFYERPSDGRIVFIPWGPDATFTSPRLLFEGQQAPWSVMATGLLTRRLYLHPEGQVRYLTALRRMLREAWDPEALTAQGQDFSRLIEPALSPQQRAGHRSGRNQVFQFIEAQRDRVLGEIERSPATWRVPLRGDFCLSPVGAATVTFETTWGTWPTDDTFATGEGTLAGSLRGDSLDTDAVGGAAGPGEGGRTEIIVPAFLADETLVFFFVAMAPARFVEGEIALGEQVECSFNRFNPRTQRINFLADCGGRMVMEAASQQGGQPVRGRLELELFGQ